MEFRKIKVTLSLLIGLAVLSANAQNSSDWQLKVGTNYAHGFITENTQTMQLHGLIGFEKNSFELRLDGFYLLGQQGERERFSINNQVFIGGYYYLLKNKVKPYFGGQIGLANSQSTEYGIINESDELVFEPTLNPIVSIGLGIDYKINNRLDLNVECRQIFGKHLANSYSTYLDEFRVSVGIGYYLINRTTN